VSEAEILQGLFSAIGSVITIFSLFFTMVSGYLVSLYLFLGRAPFALRFVAFTLLSIGLAFLGGSVAVIQTIQNGLFAAWAKLPSPAIDLRQMRNPLPVAVPDSLPFSQQQIGVGIGWSTAILVYIALAYFTFVYRWPAPGDRPTVEAARNA
jgi:hypothetical protein